MMAVIGGLDPVTCALVFSLAVTIVCGFVRRKSVFNGDDREYMRLVLAFAASVGLCAAIGAFVTAARPEVEVIATSASASAGASVTKHKGALPFDVRGAIGLGSVATMVFSLVSLVQAFARTEEQPEPEIVAEPASGSR